MRRFSPLVFFLAGAATLWAGLRGSRGASASGGPRRLAAVGASITQWPKRTPGRHEGGYAGAAANHLPPGSSAVSFGYQGQGSHYIASRVGEALAERPTDLVVLGGVNDAASGRSAAHAIEGLRRAYAAGRAAGVRVVGVTITPWGAYRRTNARQQAVSAAVNRWILNEAPVDAAVDTRVLGDANGRLLSRYDSGDHLHLNAAGQRALGRQIYEAAFR